MIGQLSINIREHISASLRSHHVLKSLLAAVLIGFLVQFPSIKEIPDAMPNLALLEISHSVWQQIDYPEGTHLEKKTLRPFVPLVIRALRISETWQIYCLFVVSNALFLWLLILLFNRLTGDRLFSFYICIAYACVYGGCMGFVDTKGWSDVIPCLLVLLALLFSHPTVIAPAFFLALACDERTLIALPYVWLWHVFREGNYEKFEIRKGILKTVGVSFSLFLSILGFIGLRCYMLQVLDFHNCFSQVGYRVFLNQEPAHLYLGVWSPFEALWIFPILLVIGCFMRGKRLFATLLTGAILFTTVITYSVHDITRSLIYQFPLIVLSIVYFYRTWENREYVLKLTMLVALICLLCPTQNVFSKVITYSPVVFHLSHLKTFLH